MLFITQRLCQQTLLSDISYAVISREMLGSKKMLDLVADNG